MRSSLRSLPGLPVILLFLAGLPAGGSAQVNIERLRFEEDSLGLTGSVGVTLAFATGNTEKRRDFDWTGAERVSNKGLLHLQPRLGAFDDIRLLSQNRLAVQLMGPLSLDVTFDLYYDADPPDDTEPLDTSLRTGIAVRF